MNDIEKQILQDYYGTTENVDINDVFTELEIVYNADELKAFIKSENPEITDWSF